MGFVKSTEKHGFEVTSVAGQAELVGVPKGAVIVRAAEVWLYSYTLQEAKDLITELPRPLILEMKHQTKETSHKVKSMGLQSAGAGLRSLRDSASCKMRLSFTKSASLRDSAGSKMRSSLTKSTNLVDSCRDSLRSSFRNLIPRNDPVDGSPDSVACNVAVLLEPPPDCEWGRSSFDGDDFLTISLEDDNNEDRKTTSLPPHCNQWVDTDQCTEAGCPATPPGRPQQSPSLVGVPTQSSSSSSDSESDGLRSKISSAGKYNGQIYQPNHSP